MNRRGFFATLLAPLALGPLKKLLPAKAVKPAGEVIFHLPVTNLPWKYYAQPQQFSHFTFSGFQHAPGDIVWSNLITTPPMFKLSEETVAWAVGKINQMPEKLKS